MKNKNDAEYFRKLKELPFDEYMECYSNCMVYYNEMMFKVNFAIKAGENPSRNLRYKMRQISIDVEKFGKQFRERTIAMEKQNEAKALG